MIARMVEWLAIASVRLVAGAPPAYRGAAPSTGQCIFVANHASHLDTPLLLSALPAPVRRRVRPVAAADYWGASTVRRCVIRTVFRGVMVEREAGRLNPLEPAAAALDSGTSLIFFPEGTRGPGGTLLPLKPGIFLLAKSYPDVDIVPVWIGNSFRVLPKGFAIPLPVSCSITFGAALRYQAGQRQEEFLAAVRTALEGLRRNTP